ncbi:SusC/RagA family TonB-linked outer membrane protein [Gracilimonas sp. Q87]|uniref:SusC/RagA family TonB-linked outer membrane protein n=1 Tax=Gracilimonas sp. Q87 TaxID=3384766 RepID=UPI0039842274
MMKKLLQLSSCFMLLLFVSVGSLHAQTVSGVVVSAEDNEPLPSITVLVEGTNKGTATNLDGEYDLELTSDEFQNGTLVFSGVGFVRQEVPVNGRQTIDIELATDTQLLDEVVVVGFGSIVREDMTGNIASVNSEELAAVPVNSFESALQGKASGVFIQKSNGKLGQGINIRVRGTSSISASSQPLYVIDGIPVISESQSLGANTNPLASLNIDDIESVDILKDASAAAIYGSRGANGVILITTKSGQAGETRIDVSYERGYSTETNRVEFLNADEYVELFTEAAERYPFGDLTTYAESVFDFFAQGTNWETRQIDTDWQDESFQDASNTEFGVQVSGGTEKTRFFVSGAFSDQIGIVRGNEFNRMNTRLNLDHTASDKFEVGINLGLSRTENIRVANDNAFATPLQAIAQSPLSPVYTPQFENGELAGFSDVPNENTLYYNFLRHVQGVDNNQTMFRNIGNLYANYEILDNLEFRSEAGLDLLFQNEDYFADSNTNTGENTNGYGDSRWVNLVNYTLNNYLTWTEQFSDNHQLTTVAGVTVESSDRYQTFVSGTNFPTDSFRKLASAAEITGGNTTETEYKYLSYFARTNYKFSNKYLLSGSARVDGSSRFGENSRYGFFPAVSAGWIMSEEDFLSDLDALSFLKLRGSYGLTGNSNVGNFPSRGLYGGTGYAGSSGLVPSQTPNPDLKWERTAQYNIGIDFALFSDRIGGEIDYYVKKTDDLLLNVNVPATTGYTSQLRNVGELENKGFEFVINTQNTTGAFRWNTNFNIAFNENKVTNLGGQVITGGFLNRAIEGEPIAVMFGKEYAGVDPDNGDALYYLHTSDGKDYSAGTTNDYSAANDVVIGNPNPDFVGGLTNNFNYRNFDLGVLLQFVYGNDIYNGGGRYQSANGDFFDNQTVDQLNRWQEPGDITDIPEARLFGSNGSNPSSRYISDGSYLRLKSVTLGYTLPQDLLSRLQLRDVRVYMTGVNLLTFTDYEGWDPEVNTDLYDLSNNLNIGNDFYSAPQARTISFGINIGF